MYKTTRFSSSLSLAVSPRSAVSSCFVGVREALVGAEEMISLPLGGVRERETEVWFASDELIIESAAAEERRRFGCAVDPPLAVTAAAAAGAGGASILLSPSDDSFEH